MKFFDEEQVDIAISTKIEEVDWKGLVKPSKEQQEILNELANGKSIKVIANAGTGKTTLSLQIAKTFKNKKVLILTFNAKNKEEGRKKVVRLSLPNTEYTGFDAFFQKITYKNCQAGIDVKDLPLFEEKFKQKVDILILDEAQDLTEKYYKEILTIIKYNPQIQVVAVGDPMQAVAESFGSQNHDRRFFTLLDKILEIKFVTKPLSLTYRHGQEVCDFVHRGTSALKEGTTIKQFSYNEREPWTTYERVREEIKDWDETESIYIAPAPKLFLSDLQYLKGAQELFYITDSRLQQTQAEQQYMKNKHCLISIHKSKGLEWNNVLYFRRFHSNTQEEDKAILDYVAKTRCIKNLVVVNFRERPREDNNQLTVTSLCQYINTDYASSVLSYSKPSILGEPTSVDFSKTYIVGDKEITENEMLFFEAKIKEKSLQDLKGILKNFNGYKLPLIDEWREAQRLPRNKIQRKWEDFDRLDISQTLTSYLASKFTQLWAEVEIATKTLDSQINGRVDFLSYSDGVVLELKIKNGEFTIDDKIQLALYKAMLVKQHPEAEEFEYILYNPVTQQEMKLESPQSICRDILEKQVSFRVNPPLLEEEFIERHKVELK